MQMRPFSRPIVYQDELSIGAGVTEPNVAKDNRLVQLPKSGRLGLAINGSAAGLRVQLTVGSDEVVTDSAVNAFNRSIETDKDFLVRGIPVSAGERVTLRISNPTAGALTATWRLILI